MGVDWGDGKSYSARIEAVLNDDCDHDWGPAEKDGYRSCNKCGDISLHPAIVEAHRDKTRKETM